MASALPGAIDRIPWEKDRVFKAGGNMIARSGLEANSRDSFRVEDKRILELTDQPGICPASYLTRVHALVVAGRLKKTREILQPLEDG